MGGNFKKLNILFGWLLFCFAFLIFIPAKVYGVVGAPKILNHQGRLFDASENPLGGSGANFCFKFSIYDDAVVGAPDNKLWPSVTSSVMTVNVKSGVFNVGIGDTSAGGDALDYNFQDNDTIFLNVEVGSQSGGSCAGATFENLGPRQRVFASGYAINADTIDGFHATQAASGNQIPALTSGNLILGAVNPQINATSTNTLTLQGGSGTGDIQFFSSANKITSVGSLTLAGIINTPALNISSTSATSTFSTGGLTVGGNQFTIQQTSGNIGIGTATPQTKLSIVGAAGTDIFNIASSSGISFFRIDQTGRVGINSSSPIASLAVQGTVGSNPFSINSSTGASLLTILQNGNVGINSSNPQTKLSIVGTAGTDILNIASSSGTSFFIIDSSGGVGIGATPSVGFKFTANGRVNLDNTIFSSAASMDVFLIDSSGDVGQYASMDAVDMNALFVSYYDSKAGNNKDLKFAKSINGGTSWTIFSVDTAGDVGQYTSIQAVDTSTLFISYYDVTSGDLKFAKSINGGASWTVSSVDSSGDVGRYTSIQAVDANTLFVSYYDVTSGELKFAKSINGGASWTVSSVDSSGNVGQYTSIQAIDTSTLFISYYGVTSGNLKFAKSINGGTSWTIFSVDTAGDVGQYTSIQAVDTSTLFISYYDVTSGDLKFAKSINGGASWTVSSVDSSGDVGRYTSIQAVDANTLFVSYYYVTSGDLKFAKSINGGASWTVSSVDSSGNVGQYTSISGLGANAPLIVYYGVTASELKFTKLNPDTINVGIGTTSTAGFKLKINGAVRATGGFSTGDELSFGNLDSTTDFIQGSANLDLIGTIGHNLTIRDWDNVALKNSLRQGGAINPAIVGGAALNLPGRLMQAYNSGNFIYTIFDNDAGTGSLRVVDATDPANPAVVGGSALSLPGFARSVYVAGHYAYVVFRNTTSTDVFRVVDISNPSSPSVVGGSNLSLPANGQHVFVSGRYVYVTFDSGAGTSTMRIIDVGNPANPIVVGGASLSLPAAPRQVYVSGRYAYVAFYSAVNTDAFRIIDISDSTNPTVVGGGDLVLGFSAWSINVSGRYAYIGFDNGAGGQIFRVVDISDPANPSITGGSALDSVLPGFAKSVFVAGNYAYLVHDISASSSLRVIDVSDPANPKIISGANFVMPGFPKSVFVRGRYAYIGFFQGAGTDAFRVVDISGIEAVSMIAHSLSAGSLQVTANAIIQNQLSVGGGLNIGGGLYISGGAGITGDSLFTPLVNSTNTVRIQNAAGSETLFTADTANNRLKIGDDDTAGNPTTLLVLDTKADAGDPAGASGATYYNASTQKFRCFENNAWKDCDTTGAGGGATFQGYSLLRDAVGVTMTNAASNGGTEITNLVSRRQIDFTGMTNVRAQFAHSLNSATVKLRIDFSTSSCAAFNAIPLVSAFGAAVGANNIQTSSFATIPTAAKTDVCARAVIIGNDTLDPIVRYITLDVN